jgi:hypothetical protein
MPTDQIITADVRGRRDSSVRGWLLLTGMWDFRQYIYKELML